MQSSTTKPSRPLEVIGRHPSALLLAAQLVVVLAYPALEDSAAGRAVVGVFQMVVVLSAVWAVRRTTTLRWVVLLLGAPAVVLAVLEAVQPDVDWIVVTSAALHVPFYFFVSYAMIRYLFHDDRVTLDEIFATGAAFTVVAWAFAYLYAAVQVVWPDSYINGEGFDRSWFELLYLSFSTLTSVGLSDIVAVGEQARALLMVEMMVGVFYVAMVVSRMVGLTMMRRSR